MKAAVSIIIVFLFVFCIQICFAEGEITFNGIPWLTDEKTAQEILMDKGFMISGSELSFQSESRVYLIENEEIGYQPTSQQKYNDVCKTISLGDKAKGKSAGYPIKNIQLTFAYDGYYKLIAVTVEFIGADYQTILNKLSNVYGKCETKSIEDEVIISNVWKGENNSAVQLYTESEGYDFTLIYGRTDAVEILKKCLEIDSEETAGI